jgi:hypothetical protein
MRRRCRATIQDLRLAIDCLPARTRHAMLAGIRENEIIVGAYTDRDGGVCPMLAAHRAGGRTNFIGFARAWDRFTQAGRRSRRATDHEVRVLTTHLEASLLDDDGPAPDLARALREHRELLARQGRNPELDRGTRWRPREHPSDRRRPGDPDRSRELRDRPGWAWLRVFRRYDDYERALERLHSQQQALAKDGSERELVR